MVKEICERCGKAYEAGPNTHYCKEWSLFDKRPRV